MTLKWQEFPGAPVSGTEICQLGDIPEQGVLSIMLGEFPLLVLKHLNVVRVFVNACPHQFLPLDLRSDSILSTDGLRLICSNHQAEFRILDGTSTSGPAKGCRLAEVSTHITTDRLIVTAQSLNIH